MDDEQARRWLGQWDGRPLRRAVFDGAALSSVRFAANGWFDRCSFAGADLRQATLDGANFKMCDFRGADLRGASIRGASFGGCDFRDADLRGADLTGAQLGYVNTGQPDWGLTDVTGADFTNALLADVTAQRVRGWPATAG